MQTHSCGSFDWVLVGSRHSAIDSSAPVGQWDPVRAQVCSSTHAQALADLAQSKKEKITMYHFAYSITIYCIIGLVSWYVSYRRILANTHLY